MAVVWAFKRVAALKHRTGFVEVDDLLAARLIRDGDAQDPRIGGHLLKKIDGRTAAQTTPEPKPAPDTPPRMPEPQPATPEPLPDAPGRDEPPAAAHDLRKPARARRA